MMDNSQEPIMNNVKFDQALFELRDTLHQINQDQYIKETTGQIATQMDQSKFAQQQVQQNNINFDYFKQQNQYHNYPAGTLYQPQNFYPQPQYQQQPTPQGPMFDASGYTCLANMQGSNGYNMYPQQYGYNPYYQQTYQPQGGMINFGMGYNQYQYQQPMYYQQQYGYNNVTPYYEQFGFNFAEVQDPAKNYKEYQERLNSEQQRKNDILVMMSDSCIRDTCPDIDEEERRALAQEAWSLESIEKQEEQARIEFEKEDKIRRLKLAADYPELYQAIPKQRIQTMQYVSSRRAFHEANQDRTKGFVDFLGNSKYLVDEWLENDRLSKLKPSDTYDKQQFAKLLDMHSDPQSYLLAGNRGLMNINTNIQPQQNNEVKFPNHLMGENARRRAEFLAKLFPKGRC